MRYIYLTLIILLTACAGGNEADSEQKEEIKKLPEQKGMMKAPEIIGQEISYSADSVQMKGYLAYDENLEGKRPGVLVVHEWWGHNEHTRNAAEKLAKAGYVAFALDMYGDGKQANHPDDAATFSSAVMSDFPEAKERFNAAMEVLKQSEYTDSEEIAAIGYCFGGGVVLNMARQGADLDAVATFHGSITPIERAQPGEVKAKILIMNGAEDPFVTKEAIADLKEEMKEAKVNFEFVNYPGAVHAFTNPAATKKGEEFGLPLAYNAKADSSSWSKLQVFLSNVFRE